jgi:diadenosine tetraphosphate (Ap4A) HIT family hydrolase
VPLLPQYMNEDHGRALAPLEKIEPVKAHWILPAHGLPWEGSCAFERRPDAPPRERIYLDARWRVAHAFGTAQPGWLVVLPRRHVLSLDELSRAEVAALGPLLRAVTAALREVTGCAKTYVALFAEAEGFGHVHFHVVPRPADLDPQLRGPRIFALLGGDPARHVPGSDMDQLAGQLTAALSRAR